MGQNLCTVHSILLWTQDCSTTVYFKNLTLFLLLTERSLSYLEHDWIRWKTGLHLLLQTGHQFSSLYWHLHPFLRRLQSAQGPVPCSPQWFYHPTLFPWGTVPVLLFMYPGEAAQQSQLELWTGADTVRPQECGIPWSWPRDGHRTPEPTWSSCLGTWHTNIRKVTFFFDLEL